MDHVLKQEMDKLKEEVGEISTNVKEMHYALVGNKIGQDGGLVKRISDLEKDVERLEIRIEALETEKSKSDIYVKIMWGLGGIVCTGVVGYLLHLIFNK